MDDERVLSGFRRTCRIKTDARPYGGWENSLIAGHALGHFFSALSMQVKCGGDDTKAREIVKGLRECQEKKGIDTFKIQQQLDIPQQLQNYMNMIR